MYDLPKTKKKEKFYNKNLYFTKIEKEARQQKSKKKMVSRTQTAPYVMLTAKHMKHVYKKCFLA